MTFWWHLAWQNGGVAHTWRSNSVSMDGDWKCLSWSWGWCPGTSPWKALCWAPQGTGAREGARGKPLSFALPTLCRRPALLRQLPYSCWYEARLEVQDQGTQVPICLPACSFPLVFPDIHHLMPVPSHVANERPIQTSLADQLAFFRFPKLIMSLSLVQFQQLMYLCIHKWLFVFNLSDMFAAVLSSLGTHLSLCFVLLPL